MQVARAAQSAVYASRYGQPPGVGYARSEVAQTNTCFPPSEHPPAVLMLTSESSKFQLGLPYSKHGTKIDAGATIHPFKTRASRVNPFRIGAFVPN